VFGPPDAESSGIVFDGITSMYTCDRVELEKNLADAPSTNEYTHDIVALTESICNVRDISELGVIAGSYSRFMRDPMIPRTLGEKLFRIWAENSLRGILADANYGYLRDSRVTGFISVRRHEKGGRITLIAVRPEVRGEGIGTRLVRAAESYVIETGGDTIAVATQGDNELALRLYRSSGYKEVARSRVWHVWLKPPLWDRQA
ncbi:GNAT family N-acetyltransferase, partial [Thermogutta sp.]|uniref:GNAT family N-acetyltransferase n=1 Tax=Thermogutta sp. TaxID=1962930 RepID=UPI00321FE2F9